MRTKGNYSLSKTAGTLYDMLSINDTDEGSKMGTHPRTEFAELMDRAGLAAHCPPGGESFLDMAARVTPALLDLPEGRTLIVAHAGTVRAARSSSGRGSSCSSARRSSSARTRARRPRSARAARRWPRSDSTPCAQRSARLAQRSRWVLANSSK